VEGRDHLYTYIFLQVKISGYTSQLSDNSPKVKFVIIQQTRIRTSSDLHRSDSHPQNLLFTNVFCCMLWRLRDEMQI